MDFLYIKKQYSVGRLFKAVEQIVELSMILRTCDAAVMTIYWCSLVNQQTFCYQFDK